ncbi:hypothetical protein Tco_0873026 [Tanacetum coccineum]
MKDFSSAAVPRRLTWDPHADMAVDVAADVGMWAYCHVSWRLTNKAQPRGSGAAFSDIMQVRGLLAAVSGG